MRTRDGLGMDWTRSGWTTGGLQQDSMSIGGLHVDSHRIPGGVKYTGELEGVVDKIITTCDEWAINQYSEIHTSSPG